VYLHYVKEFVKYHRRSPAEMGEEEVRSFLLYLLEERKLSHESYRQGYAALKFLYRVTLKRPFEVDSIPRPRKRRRLPNVLSGTEVEALLAAFDNLKYRAVTLATYGAGLRISEAVRLRLEDIDSKRMMLHVRQGKGGQDRSVMLPERLLSDLRIYWREQRPSDFLFPGVRIPHVRPESVRCALHKVAKQAGLKKRVTPHLLRHSFATHLVELGTDVRVIQVLLGHRHLQATTKYTQVSKRHLQRVKSPLDLLGTPSGSVLG
jgi:site-specific recombinase XerD